jgi:ATP-dependent DNA helicase RecG
MSQLSGFQILEDGDAPEDMTGILPVYPATEKLNQKFFRKVLQDLLAADFELPEVIPAGIRERFNLPDRREAFERIISRRTSGSSGPPATGWLLRNCI